MTNVSKNLTSSTKEKIEDEFTDFLAFLSAEQARAFYQSFFTESEQIMFIKRLTTIMMLEKSVPFRHIAAILDVSPMTVSRINKRKQNGEYDDFADLFATEDRENRLWKALEIAIDEGVHNYSGSSWGWLDRIDELQESQ